MDQHTENALLHPDCNLTPGGHLIGDTGAGARALVLAGIVKQAAYPINRILTVGCGTGADGQALAEFFNCRVDCTDLSDYFQPNGDSRVNFHQMDATALKFPDETFDLVYSFHALEHIPAFRDALSEMRRVLKPNGLYCISTPNRTRLVGYCGVPVYGFMDKVRSNWRDLKYRLRGRWKNEYGAHAGFTKKELLSYCEVIGPGKDVSIPYYYALYPRFRRILDIIIALRLDAIVWPAVSLLGSKAEANARA